MKHSVYIKSLETYYGEYPNGAVKLSVDNYLDEYRPENLSALIGLVIKNHAYRLGTPCVATIERIHQDHVYGDWRRNIQGAASLKEPVKAISACMPVAPDGPPATEEDRLEIIEELEKRGEDLPPWFKKAWTKGSKADEKLQSENESL